jgi:hypothetical protein
MIKTRTTIRHRLALGGSALGVLMLSHFAARGALALA